MNEFLDAKRQPQDAHPNEESDHERLPFHLSISFDGSLLPG
jgi:hypothetical protein